MERHRSKWAPAVEDGPGRGRKGCIAAGRLDDSRRELAAAHAGLAARLARNWIGEGPNRRDHEVKEAADLGLIRAALRWDGTGDFGAYANWHIRMAIRAAVQAARPSSRAGRTIGEQDDAWAASADPSPGPAEAAGARLDAAEMLSRVPEAIRPVVRLRVEGLEFAEIGAELGWHRKSAQKAYRREIGRLRESVA